MRLLILTQKIDVADPTLGFFHRWVERLAADFEAITVICLELGDYSLPSNVCVVSLGKEEGASRVKYVRRLFRYAIGKRGSYDSVFVHMNQEYVLLCGLLWKILGKKIIMWRNHPYGNMGTRIAVAFSDRVLCTSSHSFTARFKKTKLMPAGIDTDFFKEIRSVKEIPNSILYLGRISPVKRVDMLVNALEILEAQGSEVRLSVVGDPTPDAILYNQKIRQKSRVLEEKKRIKFFEAVSQSAVPELYASHAITVNLTLMGSFDKTVLEAFSCSRLVVMSNRSFEPLVPAEFRDIIFFEGGDANDMSCKIKKALALPPALRLEIGRKLRESVVANQSLEKLVSKLVSELV